MCCCGRKERKRWLFTEWHWNSLWELTVYFVRIQVTAVLFFICDWTNFCWTINVSRWILSVFNMCLVFFTRKDTSATRLISIFKNKCAISAVYILIIPGKINYGKKRREKRGFSRNIWFAYYLFPSKTW